VYSQPGHLLCTLMKNEVSIYTASQYSSWLYTRLILTTWLRELELEFGLGSAVCVAKISTVYSRKLITQPNFAVLSEHTNAAEVDFN